jgi:hypothetical protein
VLQFKSQEATFTQESYLSLLDLFCHVAFSLDEDNQLIAGEEVRKEAILVSLPLFSLQVSVWLKVGFRLGLGLGLGRGLELGLGLEVGLGFELG